MHPSTSPYSLCKSAPVAHCLLSFLNNRVLSELPSEHQVCQSALPKTKLVYMLFRNQLHHKVFLLSLQYAAIQKLYRLFFQVLGNHLKHFDNISKPCHTVETNDILPPRRTRIQESLTKYILLPCRQRMA